MKINIYGIEAKEICTKLGIKGIVGESVSVHRWVNLTVLPAEGRYKIEIDFDV